MFRRDGRHGHKDTRHSIADSRWDLNGRATTGPLAGSQLQFVTSFVIEWCGSVAERPQQLMRLQHQYIASHALASETHAQILYRLVPAD